VTTATSVEVPLSSLPSSFPLVFTSLNSYHCSRVSHLIYRTDVHSQCTYSKVGIDLDAEIVLKSNTIPRLLFSIKQ
jgi:hypothetical protein